MWHNDERLVTLPCEHRFHRMCWNQWDGGSYGHGCPICYTPDPNTSAFVRYERLVLDDPAAEKRRARNEFGIVVCCIAFTTALLFLLDTLLGQMKTW